MRTTLVALSIFVSFNVSGLCSPLKSRTHKESDIPPLIEAQNSLGRFLPEKIPALQPGFQNARDVWLLYSESFDHLSGSSRARLLRKYGLVASEGIAPLGKINDPTLDFLQRIQSETSSGVSGNNIVVAYNDMSFPVYGSSLSYSRDGGKTWKQTLPPLFAFGDGGGDPVVATGPDGSFYYAMLAFNGRGVSTIGVCRSTDGGATWSGLVNSTASVTSFSDFHDKEWLAVDNSNSPYRGTLYVTWTRFTFDRLQQSGIGFVKSTDGGRTWSTFKLIGTPANSEGFVQGSMITIGPAGEIYVAYYDSRLPGIAIVKSTDGGETFSQPVEVVKGDALKEDLILTGGFETPIFPSIAADLTSGSNKGSIYITTNVKTADPSDGSDVVLVRSVDGGATWSAPVKVTDDQTNTDQFQPSLAVDGDGTLGIMWYDRRNDPTNNVLIDVYMTISRDGGRTFSRNRRITSANWMLVPTPFGLRANYHGDYHQISAGRAGFVLSWADDRSGTDSDIYVASVTATEAESAAPDYIISGKTLSLNVLAGSSGTFTLNVSRLNNLAGAIKFEAREAPGIRFKFSQAEFSGAGDLNVTVETEETVRPGTYPVVLTGKAAGLERSTSLRLTVHSRGAQQDVPRALSDLRTRVFRPKAATDPNGGLAVAVLIRHYSSPEMSKGNRREISARLGSLGVSVASVVCLERLTPTS